MPRLQSSALPVLIEHSLIVAALAQRWAAVAAQLQHCVYRQIVAFAMGETQLSAAVRVYVFALAACNTLAFPSLLRPNERSGAKRGARGSHEGRQRGLRHRGSHLC